MWASPLLSTLLVPSHSASHALQDAETRLAREQMQGVYKALLGAGLRVRANQPSTGVGIKLILEGWEGGRGPRRGQGNGIPGRGPREHGDAEVGKGKMHNIV